ncbi:MAG: hypothetical protein DME47_03030 [Verrucomicrobia bacterium]|nr:MAG: hypothetical protein DME47_03030 [Verrucomicrobiota bacterium]
MRGITALEKLHERVGNAISRSHASGRFDNDSGLVFEWDVDIWYLADEGQDARWPDSQESWVRRGEGRRYGHCVDRALE